MKPYRVHDMPAIHAESLLALIQAVWLDDLRQTRERTRKYAVFAFRMFKIPGSAEIILGAGAADRWPVLISIQIEFDFTFTPPAVVPDSPRQIGSDVLPFAFYPIKNGMNRLIG